MERPTVKLNVPTLEGVVSVSVPDPMVIVPALASPVTVRL